jgi:outer membrane lipoprotein SlyB
MKKLILLPLMALALSACETTLNPSEGVYARPEVTQRADVERCRVLDVRQITIGADPVQQQSRYGGYGNYARQVQPETQIGTLAGGVLGAVIGQQIGGGNGQRMATAILGAAGAAAGGSYGTKRAQQRMRQPGLEYSVLLAGGREQVITQYYNQGDRIAAAGSTCRIAQSSAGMRVMPAEYLPGSVGRPRQTTFSD